jgi:putative chitinase
MLAVIDQIDAQLLKVAAPETPIQNLAQWADPLKLGCIKFQIDGVRPIAALLAQAAHESEGFTHLSENLNYSAARLCAVWPHRFPTLAAAAPYAHNPEALANFTYGNRMGNGPPASGDGWRYRGGGLFETTGHANYADLAEALGMTIAEAADYVRTVNGAAMSACYFFVKHGLIELAMTPGCKDDTKAVQGGELGLQDRTTRFNAVVAELLRRGA